MKDYILSICIAAIVCSVVSSICGKASYGSLIKMICGSFLAITVIAPLKYINLDSIAQMIELSQIDAEDTSIEGVLMAEKSACDIISQQTKTYILDKANSLGANISVDVVLDPENLNTPTSIMIEGEISPYCKQLLQSMIEKDLGVPKENQIWR